MPPSYDPAGKKLYWAKRLHFAGSPADTLNYGIRVLGRSGVLVLNVVGGMEQLEDIQAKAPALLASVDFNPASRYADFNPATDHVAEYGIAALIAWRLAAGARDTIASNTGSMVLGLPYGWSIALCAALAAFLALAAAWVALRLLRERQ